MELNYFKDRLFDLLNDSEGMGIADLNTDERNGLLTVMTDDCYRIVEDCIHEHAESCYPADNASESEATPADAEEKQPTECSHSCSGDSGCITKEPDCQHEHDDSCGYRVGTPGTETGDETKEPDGEPAGKPDNGQEKCICEEPCEESSGNEGGRVNKECPVCGAENAGLSDCKGKAEKEDTKQPEDTGICKHHGRHFRYAHRTD